MATVRLELNIYKIGLLSLLVMLGVYMFLLRETMIKIDEANQMFDKYG